MTPSYPIENFEWQPHLSVLRQNCKKLGIDRKDLPGKIHIVGISGKTVTYHYMAKDGSLLAAYNVAADSLEEVPSAKGTYLYLEF